MPNQNKSVEREFISPARLAGCPLDTPVLLAFSGGADSRALLHLLAMDAAQNGYTLTLAHVNHGIRGEEAARDREFCKRLADDYGLEICVLDADVPARAKANGRGLEEEARVVRYEYFAQLMQERGIPLLATAHHADDNLETALFRLARGSGLTGLCGILPTRSFEGGVLTRPLLKVSRNLILDYCRKNGLEYVTDSTNADLQYTRNRIRGEVIPRLDEMFDGVAERFAATAEALREDEALLSGMASDWLERARVEDGLSCATLCEMPSPLAKRVLARRFCEITGRELERVHIDALMRLVADGSTTAEIALPSDYIALLEFGCLRFLACDHADRSQTVLDLPFAVGSTLVTESGIRLTVERNDASLSKIHNSSTRSYIILYMTSDIMKKALHWRTRREGDLLLQGGMHRKLRRLYREAGIAPRWRTRMPLLCDGEGIVWAPFVGARDGLPQSGEAYRITVELPTVNGLQENGHYQ